MFENSPLVLATTTSGRTRGGLRKDIEKGRGGNLLEERNQEQPRILKRINAETRNNASDSIAKDNAMEQIAVLTMTRASRKRPALQVLGPASRYSAPFAIKDDILVPGATTKCKTYLPYYKRRRLLERQQSLVSCVGEEQGNTGSITFSSLNSDCMIQVLQFLSLDDLNSFVVTCKRSRLSRRHVTLDQTRSGTISLGGPGGAQNIMHLLLTIQKQRWAQVFGGNRNRLKLVGLPSLDASKMGDLKKLARGTKLDEVTQLDMSSSPSSPRKQLYVKNSVGKALSLILPNLRQVDMSHVRITQTAAEAFAKNCPQLESLRWNGSNDGLHITGQDLKICRNLKELYLDEARLYFGRPQNIVQLFMKELDHVPQEADVWILFACSSNLERVSLRKTKWFHFWLDCGRLGPQPAYPLQQEGLMKFVRRTPTL